MQRNKFHEKLYLILVKIRIIQKVSLKLKISILGRNKIFCVNWLCIDYQDDKSKWKIMQSTILSHTSTSIDNDP